MLVTGVGGRSVGAGVLHALMRADPAVRSRWETVGTDTDPFSWGLYVADRGALVPPAGDPGYIDRICELVDAHRVSAIVPGTEPELMRLSEHHARLPVPLIANEPRLMALIADKRATEARLRELGLRCIPSVPWESRARAVAQFGFPLLVKPTRGTGGSRGVHLVATPAELDALAPFVSPASQPVVQPYVGDGDHEYTVGVLSDTAGRVIDSIVIRRKLIGLSLLGARPHAGRTAAVSTGISQGFVVREPGIQSYCEDLARRLDSRGPLNLQLRVDGGECVVFEIHPRFSGTTPIRASVGFNEPDVLLRHHLYGERFTRLDYRSDVAAIRALEHVVVPLGEMHDRSAV